MKTLVLIIGLLGAQVVFAIGTGFADVDTLSRIKTGGCKVDEHQIPFVYQGGAFAVSIAQVTANIFAEYKDVWNEDILTIIHNGNIIAVHSELMARHLQVAAKIDGHSIECQINK
jgi:hypothetical protein